MEMLALVGLRERVSNFSVSGSLTHAIVKFLLPIPGWGTILDYA